VFGNHCPQLPSDFGLPSDTEDCLVLNVYVPVRHGFPSDSRRNRPVMVWIHGGAFSVGESDVYDPTRLVAQDVIVITINYRLGAAETPGSNFAIAVGCSDQTAACLRAVPVDQVLANWGTGLTSTTPVIDGVVIPEPLRNAFASGHFNRVPIIEGSNHDEFRL